MKWQRCVLVLIVAGIVPASIFLTASQGVADADLNDEILHAYMEAPDIATEIENLRSHGYRDGGAHTMLVSGSCGVAGCSYEYLVVQVFSSSGTNPQTNSILARVHGGPLGKVGRVERVELRPKPELPVIEGDPAANQKLRVINTSSARSPKMSAEPLEQNP